MRLSVRSLAILQALFVTFLWSTSWVLIKLNLNEIPPVTFAGLRYTIAFLILLPGLWKYRTDVRNLAAKDWRQIIVLGLVFYTLTQGGQFITLNHLDAVSFSLLLNFTALLVAIFGIVFLKEILIRSQWYGIIIFIGGIFVYFSLPTVASGKLLGYTLGGFTVIANAAASVLGRSINRGGKISPMVVTVISMGVGAVILLGFGLVFQGLPSLSLSVWLSILWLAIINTSFAFYLWNKTLQTLTAIESSIINNTMLIQIALLAWLFLGETITPRGILGLVIAAIGIFLVNWKSH